MMDLDIVETKEQLAEFLHREEDTRKKERFAISLLAQKRIGDDAKRVGRVALQEPADDYGLGETVP
jgi:hypothetical protein